MNSKVSDIDTVQADDIAGVQSLYNDGPAYQSSVPGPVLSNLSTRGFVGLGDEVLIGGFIVQGAEPATVILRAIAFSLFFSDELGALRDPTITVYDSNQRQIAFNDDWALGPAAETIASYHLDPPNSHESALYLTLPPGAYTAVVQSFSDAQYPPTTGQALFELYDLHTTDGRAGNISTRGLVSDPLIGGFIVGAAKTIIARGIGPSLGNAGVVNPLPDPKIELHDSYGELFQSNDDWQEGPDAAAITAAGLAPTNPKESALLATVAPVPYTAVLSPGFNNGNGGGVALVEIYDTSPAP